MGEVNNKKDIRNSYAQVGPYYLLACRSKREATDRSPNLSQLKNRVVGPGERSSIDISTPLLRLRHNGQPGF